MARGDVALSLRGIEASLLRGLIGVRPRHTSEGDSMSSSMRRLALVACVVILLAGAIALAQDRAREIASAAALSPSLTRSRAARSS